MTRQVIIRRRDYYGIRRRDYYGGSSREGSFGANAAMRSDAPHHRFREPPLAHDAVDPTASRWWRATRMGRRPHSLSKS